MDESIRYIWQKSFIDDISLNSAKDIFEMLFYKYGNEDRFTKRDEWKRDILLAILYSKMGWQ